MGLRDAFKNFKTRLQEMAKAHAPGPPPGIEDPLASQIDWTPAKGGGSSFRTHKLVAFGAHQVRFKITLEATVFCLLFLLAGLGAMGAGVYSLKWLVLGEPGEWMPGLFLVPFGLVFAAVGGFLLRSMSKPACFDKSCGLFWKGKEDVSALLPAELDARDDIVKLDDIHALQILRERCTSTSSKGHTRTYYGYELNLVLHDGTRINVVDHGKPRKLREDADLLSQFLGKPIWDGS